MPRHVGGDRFNAVFRLCCYLRTAPGGCDTKWIKVPSCQRLGRKPHWYQNNLAKLAQIRLAESITTRDRVRAGRLARWLEQGQKLREQFSVGLSQPLCLQLPGSCLVNAVGGCVTGKRVKKVSTVLLKFLGWVMTGLVVTFWTFF